MTRGIWLLTSALVMPLALLLFAQWPLRDWIQAYSLQVNDAAQIVFAWYAAIAITAASRANSHLAANHRGQRVGKLAASWRPWALLACVGPWSLLLLWTAIPQMLASIGALEKFNESLSSGYFLLRVAVVLLALLVIVNAVLAALRRP
jgi:hypothetical protein